MEITSANSCTLTDMLSARSKERLAKRLSWYTSGAAHDTARSIEIISSLKFIVSKTNQCCKTCAEAIAWAKPCMANISSLTAEENESNGISKKKRVLRGSWLLSGMNFPVTRSHETKAQCMMMHVRKEPLHAYRRNLEFWNVCSSLKTIEKY